MSLFYTSRAHISVDISPPPGKKDHTGLWAALFLSAFCPQRGARPARRMQGRHSARKTWSNVEAHFFQDVQASHEGFLGVRFRKKNRNSG